MILIYVRTSTAVDGDNMKRYLTELKGKAERDGRNKTNEGLPKAKTREHDEANVALGFTVVRDTERPAC